ncbi:MAG: DNA-processing protein DprA [Butyricicoccus sp.]|nr:DNA-processing protein DprA [Butyricicoccus sp.]
MNRAAYWLWLAAKDGMTALAKNQLLSRFGTPEHLYAMTRAEWEALPGLTRKQIDALSDKSLERARAIAFDCEKLHIQIITQADSAYPDILRSIPDPPLVLYVKGTLPDLEGAPGVGVVGTRKASPYGLLAANEFGKGLARAGFTVVSGMALGADAAAARGALEAGGKTIAVLAGGLNICYPPQNNFLMGDIQLSGAVISENPPSTPHDGFRFPIRNRIISGLSRGVLIVEAPKRSGALITAHLALDQGREVFAIPGTIHAPNSVGCNQLIRDGEAALVMRPGDIAQALGHVARRTPEVSTPPAPLPAPDLWDKIQQYTEQPETPAEPAPAGPPKIPDSVNDTQREILKAVLDGAETPEEILEMTDLPAARVMTELTMLELDGILGRKNGAIVRKF